MARCSDGCDGVIVALSALVATQRLPPMAALVGCWWGSWGSRGAKSASARLGLRGPSRDANGAYSRRAELRRARGQVLMGLLGSKDALRFLAPPGGGARGEGDTLRHAHAAARARASCCVQGDGDGEDERRQ